MSRALLHQVMMLGDRAGDFDHRRFLKGIGADDVGGNLAGDGDQGNRVELGVGQAGDQVRAPPGPEVAMHTPGLPVTRAYPSAAKIAALLMPRQDGRGSGRGSASGPGAWACSPRRGRRRSTSTPWLYQRLHDDVRPTNGRGRAGGRAGTFAGRDRGAAGVDHCHSTIRPQRT